MFADHATWLYALRTASIYDPTFNFIAAVNFNVPQLRASQTHPNELLMTSK
jgi:hypothetical protein